MIGTHRSPWPRLQTGPLQFAYPLMPDFLSAETQNLDDQILHHLQESIRFPNLYNPFLCPSLTLTAPIAILTSLLVGVEGTEGFRVLNLVKDSAEAHCCLSRGLIPLPKVSHLLETHQYMIHTL